MTERMRKEFEEWMTTHRIGLLKYSTMYSAARRGNGYVDSITNMLWESWQAAYRTALERKVDRVEVVKGATSAKYGCHCDLEAGMEPDDCVIDSGQINDCVYAQIGIRENSKFRKEDCKYWQPINIKALAGEESEE